MLNVFSTIPAEFPGEVVQSLLNAPTVRIERIVSQGQASAPEFWYDQSENEWVVLLAGAARLQFENELIELRPGDCMQIPAHTSHRVDWTTADEPTIWLAVFYT